MSVWDDESEQCTKMRWGMSGGGASGGGGGWRTTGWQPWRLRSNCHSRAPNRGDHGRMCSGLEAKKRKREGTGRTRERREGGNKLQKRHGPELRKRDPCAAKHSTVGDSFRGLFLEEREAID